MIFAFIRLGSRGYEALFFDWTWYMEFIFGLGITLLGVMAFLTAAAGIPHGVLIMCRSKNPSLLLLFAAVVALMSYLSALNAILLAKTTFTFGDFDGFHASVLLASGETKAVDTRLDNGNEARLELLKLQGTLVPHGEYKQYYSDGKPERKLKYYFGVPHGEVAYCYPDGQMAVSGKMSLGAPVEEWKYWYSNGRIAAVGIQSDQSSWHYYDPDGDAIDSMAESIGTVSSNFLKSGIRLDDNSIFYFDVLEAPVWVRNRKGVSTKMISPFDFPVP